MTTSVSEGIEKLAWIMICFLPLYSVARIFWLKRKAGKGAEETLQVDWAREIVLALFLLFMTGLFGLTFENQGVKWLSRSVFSRAAYRLRKGIGINFMPFRTIQRYLKFTNQGTIMVNIVGNIVMFLPWGFGLPLLWKKQQNVLKLTSMSLMLPVYIEFLQLFIGRSVDVDDVILNFAGGMLGGLLYWLAAQIFPGLKKLSR